MDEIDEEWFMEYIDMIRDLGRLLDLLMDTGDSIILGYFENYCKYIVLPFDVMSREVALKFLRQNTKGYDYIRIGLLFYLKVSEQIQMHYQSLGPELRHSLIEFIDNPNFLAELVFFEINSSKYLRARHRIKQRLWDLLDD